MISSLVQETVEKHLQEKLYSACAVGIQLHGKNPQFFTVGKSSLANNAKKVDSTSLFDIASLTKVVYTTTLAADAYERKLLQLEDKIGKWMPENFFQNYSITDLLLHQARLRPRLRFHLACPKLHEGADDRTLTKRIIQAIAMSSISTAPQKVVYSDPGFILMAEILTTLFNEPAEVSWAEKIQGPMKLKHTKTRAQLTPKDTIVATDMDLSLGDIHDPDARYIGRLCGHAGLFSSIEDMVSFGSSWLSDYLGEEKKFKKETVQRFIDPYIQTHERVLGWDKPSPQSTAGNISPKSIGHLGFTGTSLWVDLEKKCVVSILSNRVIMGVGNTDAELKAKTAAFNVFRREIHNQIWETCLK